MLRKQAAADRTLQLHKVSYISWGLLPKAVPSPDVRLDARPEKGLLPVEEGMWAVPCAPVGTDSPPPPDRVGHWRAQQE